ncbi:RNA-binding protein [Methylovirgula sp. 4M-Z18]|uniref:RNA-binding protein n=1 Tax=Methylovirgula sp. 4M-Z18 TaxID=2293567 RepID=UPI000E2E6767|nr:RNA-binding protein [Methylovirgula sp. 4M-Z18]RFB77933.1 RNA-binding protein [Methylovirgula sp. 4M-Z18]
MSDLSADALDDGKPAGGSERTCIVSRATLPPAAMIRFVLAPDGEVTPDIRRKLPGRGVWVTARASVLAEALRKKAFDKAFKKSVRAPDKLVSLVDHLLEQDALQSLSMANKAGVVTTGAAKIEAALVKKTLAAVLHAADGSADGVRKLRQVLRRQLGEAGNAIAEIGVFSSVQLDLALGRVNVIHACLDASPVADAFLNRARRLQDFREDPARAEP